MRKLAFCLLTLVAVPALAGDLDDLVGTWESPDGYAKMKFEKGFDGSWFSYDMWFSGEEGWKHVARGAMYPRPGKDGWSAIARSRDMEGIVLFESEVVATGEGRFHWINKAFKEDGTVMSTTEDWQFDGPDRFNYEIFLPDSDEQHPWMTGSWVRVDEEN